MSSVGVTKASCFTWPDKVVALMELTTVLQLALATRFGVSDIIKAKDWQGCCALLLVYY